MNITNDLTPTDSIWQPQFIEKINQDICLNCDRFYEVGGRNALKLQSATSNNSNIEHQAITIANPQQCADCEVCTSSYPEQFYSHYSFSI